MRMTHPVPCTLFRLLAASAPGAALPMPAPTTSGQGAPDFIPSALIADARASGFQLWSKQRILLAEGDLPASPTLMLTDQDGSAIVSSALAAQWDPIIARTPDWHDQVHRALAAERGPDPVFAVIEGYTAAREAWDAGMKGKDADGTEPESLVLEAARQRLLNAAPTSVPGLTAWISKLNNVLEREGDWFFAHEALPGINAACAQLLWSVVPRIGPKHDAALIAAGEAFERLTPLVQDAGNERYRLQALRDEHLPPSPAGLMVDPARPFNDGAVEHFTAPEGPHRYYSAKAVERLRAKPRMKEIVPGPVSEGDDYNVVLRRVPDPDEQARAERIIAAFDAWDAECQALPEAIAHAAAVAEHERLEAELRAIFDQIQDAVPVSLAGLAVQGKAMIGYKRGDDLRYDLVDRIVEFAMAQDAGFPVWHPDTALLVLGAEMDAREEDLAPLRDIYNDHSTTEEQGRPYEILDDLQSATVRRIADEPATTLEGFAIKARALAYICADEYDRHSLRLENGSLDNLLMWSIVSGLRNLSAPPQPDERGCDDLHEAVIAKVA